VNIIPYYCCTTWHGSNGS